MEAAEKQTLGSTINKTNFTDLFLDNGYSIEQVLVMARGGRHKLQELRDKLIRHQQDLNQTSLELFNNSYDQFYKLSFLVSRLSEPIQKLTDPIKCFKEQVEHLCKNHHAYVREIDDKLHNLEEIDKNKQIAKQLISYIRRLSRLKELIGSQDWQRKPSDEIESQVRLDLIERTALELNHLMSSIEAARPSHYKLIMIKRSLKQAAAAQLVRLRAGVTKMPDGLADQMGSLALAALSAAEAEHLVVEERAQITPASEQPSPPPPPPASQAAATTPMQPTRTSALTPLAAVPPLTAPQPPQSARLYGNEVLPQNSGPPRRSQTVPDMDPAKCEQDPEKQHWFMQTLQAFLDHSVPANVRRR